MNKFLIILCIIEGIIIGYLLYNIPKEPEIITVETVRDSIIRDSVFIEIEKIKEKAIIIKQNYEEDTIDIMSANDSVLYESFSRYIEDYNNQ